MIMHKVSKKYLVNKIGTQYPKSPVKNGFTLIELLLAMTFVAFILVFMSLTLVQMLRIYDKAISAKQINAAGSSITEDINQTMRSQLPSSIIDTSKVKEGLLCVDGTLYEWNPLFKNNDPSDPINASTRANTDADPVTTDGAMMAKKKLRDPAVCSNSSADIDNTEPSAILLSNKSRVMWAGAKSSLDGRIVEFTLIIGTQDRSEVDEATDIAKLNSNNPADQRDITITPHKEDNQIMCHPGNDGTYCSFAEFKTIIYVLREH